MARRMNTLGEDDEILRHLRTTRQQTISIDFPTLAAVKSRIDEYCDQLRAQPLRRIHIIISPDDDLRECYDKLADVIASLEELDELEMLAQDVAGLAVMATFIHRARQIRKLKAGFQSINRDFTLDDVPAFAGALLGHPNLEEIDTSHFQSNEVRILSMVIPSLVNLRNVRLANWIDENVKPELSSDTFEFLFRSGSLSTLDIAGYTISSMSTIAQNLGSLSKLNFLRCKLPTEHVSLLTEALKNNTALTELGFDSCKPDSSFFSSLKDALTSNITLTSLTVAPPCTMPLSEAEVHDIALAVKANYSLEHLQVESMEFIHSPPSFRSTIGPHDECVFKSIPTLNRAGRSYLVEDDGASLEKGVEVLNRVSDDLDCLFLHLSENPKLCGRKRKRDESE